MEIKLNYDGNTFDVDGKTVDTDKFYKAYQGDRASAKELKTALYKAAEQVGFTIDPKWSNRDLGSKLISKFYIGPRDNGFKIVMVGSYFICRNCMPDTTGYGEIAVYHIANSTDEAV